MGVDWSVSRILNIWVVFWTNQVQMGQNVEGKWRVGGGLQMPSGVVESRMKHFLFLFLFMAVIQCYGRRRRNLELGL